METYLAAIPPSCPIKSEKILWDQIEIPTKKSVIWNYLFWMLRLCVLESCFIATLFDWIDTMRSSLCYIYNERVCYGSACKRIGHTLCYTMIRERV